MHTPTPTQKRYIELLPTKSRGEDPPPHPRGGGEAETGAQVGDRNHGTLELEGYKEMLPGWYILKALFLGYNCYGFNNLSRFDMLWNVCHRWTGGAYVVLN